MQSLEQLFVFFIISEVILEVIFIVIYFESLS